MSIKITAVFVCEDEEYNDTAEAILDNGGQIVNEEDA